MTQDPLFDLPPSGERSKQKKQKPIKSTRTAACPHCCGEQQSNQKVGVIRTSTTTEVFRNHDKFTIGGRRIPCLGSGTVAPPRQPPEVSR